MPNHCKNVLKIRCSDEALMQKIKDTLLCEHLGDNGKLYKEFTMNKYKPFPEKLSVDCMNIDDIQSLIKSDNKSNEEIKEIFKNQNKSVDSFEDWTRKNWGTKWDCYYTNVLHISPTELEVYYMTAWSPNLRFIANYINNELLGKVEYIQYYYYEYGCDFSGYYRYENGVEVQDHFDYEEMKKKYPEKYNKEYFETHMGTYEEVFEHLSPLTPEEEARVKARNEALDKELKEHPENFQLI